MSQPPTDPPPTVPPPGVPESDGAAARAFRLGLTVTELLSAAPSSYLSADAEEPPPVLLSNVNGELVRHFARLAVLEPDSAPAVGTLRRATDELVSATRSGWGSGHRRTWVERRERLAEDGVLEESGARVPTFADAPMRPAWDALVCFTRLDHTRREQAGQAVRPWGLEPVPELGPPRPPPHPGTRTGARTHSACARPGRAGVPSGGAHHDHPRVRRHRREQAAPGRVRPPDRRVLPPAEHGRRHRHPPRQDLPPRPGQGGGRGDRQTGSPAGGGVCPGRAALRPGQPPPGPPVRRGAQPAGRDGPPGRGRVGRVRRADRPARPPPARRRHPGVAGGRRPPAAVDRHADDGGEPPGHGRRAGGQGRPRARRLAGQADRPGGRRVGRRHRRQPGVAGGRRPAPGVPGSARPPREC
jgi:hypothetical protein